MKLKNILREYITSVLGIILIGFGIYKAFYEIHADDFSYFPIAFLIGNGLWLMLSSDRYIKEVLNKYANKKV